jgi:phenylpropionate dioxygenase-like ring-hydroxylating dioxygenase large terminal subunit
MMAARDVRSEEGGRWHNRNPELGTGPVSIEPYISPEHFELERERIFRKVWLNACRVEQLSEPGDYFVKDIGVCSASVIIVRGRDGKIRAFHNVCSHRGNKIAYDAQGRAAALSCRFHGWTYGLDGSLQLVPDEENFFGLDKECLGLTPVHVDVWEGFVFVSLDPDPEETLQEYLGELASELHGYPFDDTSSTAFSWRTEINANWKLVKDAFQETAHTPFQHSRSLPDAYVSEANPFTHLLDVKLCGRHARASLFGNIAHQPSPVQALAYKYGSTLVSAARPGEVSATKPVGVNPTGSRDWAFEMHVFFPSFFVAVAEGNYFTHQFLPLAVDRTLWESTTYYPRARSLAQRFSQETSRVIFRDIMAEDGRQIEETQSVLGSGAKQEFVLKDEEILVRHNLHVVDQMVRPPKG